MQSFANILAFISIFLLSLNTASALPIPNVELKVPVGDNISTNGDAVTDSLSNPSTVDLDRSKVLDTDVMLVFPFTSYNLVDQMISLTYYHAEKIANPSRVSPPSMRMYICSSQSKTIINSLKCGCLQTLRWFSMWVIINQRLPGFVHFNSTNKKVWGSSRVTGSNIHGVILIFFSVESTSPLLYHTYSKCMPIGTLTFCGSMNPCLRQPTRRAVASLTAHGSHIYTRASRHTIVPLKLPRYILQIHCKL